MDLFCANLYAIITLSFLSDCWLCKTSFDGHIFFSSVQFVSNDIFMRLRQFISIRIPVDTYFLKIYIFSSKSNQSSKRIVK